MLVQLEITNFAIIERSILKFEQGFNVLTGETGAGKSIILGAISAILGERINKSMIRKGEDKAICRAVFLKTDRLQQKLVEKGLVIEDDFVIVERVISKNGRSVVKVNDTIQTTQTIRELCGDLVEICGQRDHFHLLKDEQALDLMDGLGNKEHQLLILKYKDMLKEYQNVQKEIEELQRDGREKQQLLDLYRFQQEEIEHVKLVIGEDEELEKERKQLRHMESILNNTQNAVDYLLAIDGLYESFKSLQEAGKYDERLLEYAKRIEGSYYELDDVRSELQNHIELDSFSEGRLEYVEERLNTIQTLKRKYADTIEGVLEHLEDISKKRMEFENTEEIVVSLQKKESGLKKELESIAETLHQNRVNISQTQSKRITEAIHSLSMPDAELAFQCEKMSGFSKNGMTNIQILFTSNKGEDMKPLNKVASGGELSRVLLAMHIVQHSSEGVSTLVFDEVDEGIGGEVGRVIGEKLKELSEKVQVVVISHLPQVAAKADHHQLIQKHVMGERTISTVRKIADEERIDEIARMIYGEERTEITLKQARDMIYGKSSK